VPESLLHRYTKLVPRTMRPLKRTLFAARSVPGTHVPGYLGSAAEAARGLVSSAACLVIELINDA